MIICYAILVLIKNNNNDCALTCFPKHKVEESGKAFEIYPTEADLQALSDMELTELKDQVRVSGHKTQKTFMDYIKLSPDEIR